MSSKITRTKEDLSFLWSVSSSRGSHVIIASLFTGASEINGMTEDPGVSRTSIEKSSHQLWWIANVHVRHISIIFKVILGDVSLNLLAWFVNWAMSNFINCNISLNMRINWITAAIQLNIDGLDWSWLCVLLNSC